MLFCITKSLVLRYKVIEKNDYPFQSILLLPQKITDNSPVFKGYLNEMQARDK